MKIKVTQEHIDKGAIGCASACPVALALEEATGLNASVHDHIYLWKGVDMDKYFYESKTLKPVRGWVHEFDCGHHVEPFEFEIDYEN